MCGSRSRRRGSQDSRLEFRSVGAQREAGMVGGKGAPCGGAPLAAALRQHARAGVSAVTRAHGGRGSPRCAVRGVAWGMAATWRAPMGPALCTARTRGVTHASVRFHSTQRPALTRASPVGQSGGSMCGGTFLAGAHHLVGREVGTGIS